MPYARSQHRTLALRWDYQFEISQFVTYATRWSLASGTQTESRPGYRLSSVMYALAFVEGVHDRMAFASCDQPAVDGESCDRRDRERKREAAPKQ